MSDTTEVQTLDLKVEKFDLGTLETNAQAILDYVREKVKTYDIEHYSGDNIAEAKKDKAELNAAAKKLNDTRLEYERMWMKPFETFKKLVADACSEIKKASTAIDQVVKDVEQGEKDEKRRQIEEYWKGTACDLFPLDQIFDPRWLNKSTKYTAIEDEIDERIRKVKADLVILERLGEPEAKVCYLETLDLNKAIDRADTLKKNRERIAAEEKAREEAEAKRKADREANEKAAAEAKEADTANTIAIVDSILEEEGIEVAPEEPAAPLESVAPEPKKPELHEISLKFFGTIEQLKGLRAYIDEQGITYEKIA
jgi:hypothetical protein